uniref:Uncharacterized protein n=1 Tax=Sciurus vulgaris TaxID=55149 RepID=A0A8D2CQE7_SCIVU
MQPWTPHFQELDLQPRRACQNVAGTLEVVFLFCFVLFCFVFNFGTVDLAVRKEATTKQALPPALLPGIRRPEFLFRPSVQTDNTPSKVNYVLCLLIAECSPGPSDHLPSASPSAYRPGTGFLLMVIPTTLLLKKASFQWTL